MELAGFSGSLGMEKKSNFQLKLEVMPKWDYKRKRTV